jgi:hypothetical protein
MARKSFGPRKRRTREHVIADLSVNHVERVVLDAGCTAQRLDSDYGYDLVLFTYDDRGYIEPGSIFIQLKAAESLQAIGAHYVFDLDVRDYNLWLWEEMPVILILFDASRRRAYWLDVQRYFSADVSRHPKKGAKTVRVRVPQGQNVNQSAMRMMRNLKGKALGRALGGGP